MTEIIQYPFGLGGGMVTRVLESGTGDHKIVCLHGSGSRADRWRPVLPVLGDAGFRVFAFDYPGHGFASKPDPCTYAYGSPAFADAAIAFVEQIGGPVTWIGTSIGGHVAALAAIKRPDLVSSVVMVGAVGLVPLEPLAGSAVLDNRSLDGTRQKLEFLLSNRGLITDAWVREETLINQSPGGDAAQAGLRRYDAQSDLVGEEYKALGIPTLLCWGVEDRWVPLHHGLAMSELLPDAPLLLLSPGGHSPYYELPEEFSAAVAQFATDPGSLPAGPFGSGAVAAGAAE